MGKIDSKDKKLQKISMDMDFESRPKTKICSAAVTTKKDAGMSRKSHGKSSIDGWDGDVEDLPKRRNIKKYVSRDSRKKAPQRKHEISKAFEETEVHYLSIEDISAPDFLKALDRSSDASATQSKCFTVVSKSNGALIDNQQKYAMEEPTCMGDSLKYDKDMPAHFPCYNFIKNEEVEKKLTGQEKILNDLEMYFIKSLDVLHFNDDIPLNYNTDSCDETTEVARRFKDLMHIQDICIRTLTSSNKIDKSIDNHKNPILIKIQKLQSAIKYISNLYTAFKSYQRSVFNLKFYFNTFDLEELQSADRMQIFESRMHHLNKALEGLLHTLKSSTVKCTIICNQVYAECDHYSKLIHREIRDCNDKATQWQTCSKEMEKQLEGLHNENAALKSRVYELEALAVSRDLQFSAKEDSWKRQLDEESARSHITRAENRELKQSLDQLKARNEEITALLMTNQQDDISRFHWKTLRAQLNDVNKKYAEILNDNQNLKKSNDVLKSENFSLMSDKDILNGQKEDLETKLKSLKKDSYVDTNNNNSKKGEDIALEKFFCSEIERFSKNMDCNDIEKQKEQNNIYNCRNCKTQSETLINNQIKAGEETRDNDKIEEVVTPKSNYLVNYIMPNNIGLTTIPESEEVSLMSENYDMITERNDIIRSIGCTNEEWEKEDQEFEKQLIKDSSQHKLRETRSETFGMMCLSDCEYPISHLVSKSASADCINNLNRQMCFDVLTLDTIPELKPENIDKSKEQLFKCKHVNCKSLFYKLQEAEKKLQDKSKSVNKFKAIVLNFKRKYQLENERHVNLQTRYEKLLQEKIMLDYHIKSKSEQGETMIQFDGLSELTKYKDEIIEKLTTEKSALENKLNQIAINMEAINNNISEKNSMLKVSNQNILTLQQETAQLKTEIITLERKLSRSQASLIISKREQEQLINHYNEMKWYAKNHELCYLDYDDTEIDCNIVNNLTKLSDDNSILCKNLQNLLNELRTIPNNKIHITEGTENGLTELLLARNIQNNYMSPFDDVNKISNISLINNKLLEATKTNGSRIQLCKEGINKILLCFIILNMKYINLSANHKEVANEIKFTEIRNKTLKKMFSSEIDKCKNEIKQEIANLAKEIKSKCGNGSFISSTNSLKACKLKIDDAKATQEELNQLRETNAILEETKRKLTAETERLQIELKVSTSDATEIRRLLYEREQGSKLLQNEVTGLQEALLLNKQALKRIKDCELNDLRMELETAVRSKIELEGKLALLDDMYKALMDSYTLLKVECDEKESLQKDLVQNIEQLCRKNEELRTSRRSNGCSKDCANERRSLEDRLQKLTAEAEGARNLVTEIRRVSAEKIAEGKQHHIDETRKLMLENEEVCQCNKTLQARITRLEADNMLLAKNIDNRNRKSKLRDPKYEVVNKMFKRNV